MKAFVINLERSPDRKAYMTDQLKRQNLEFEFIKATDYKEIRDADYESLCDVAAISQNPFFTRGVLACALSHLDVYKHIVQQNLDAALVLEDDVQLGEGFNALLAEVEKEIGKKEIISFISFSHYGDTTYLSNLDKKPLNGAYSLVSPVNIEEVSCAMAYVITKDVAHRMLQVGFPVHGPADYWGGFFSRKAISYFRCVYPMPVKPASFRSVIDYAPAKTLQSKLAAFVRKYRVPFLFSYLLRKDKRFIEKKSKVVLSNDLPFYYQGSRKTA